jgi:hypothetical protein
MRGSSKALLSHPQPREAEAFGQVIRFEPRPLARRQIPASVEPVEEDSDEFARFEQEQEQPINYRQRMIMNLIALTILTLLVGLGVWIADKISDLQRQQDCLIQGRSNCAPIDLPAPMRD